MGSFANYAEDAILDHVFKTSALSQPTNIYIALCKSTIEDDDTGSTLPSEVSGGAYARKVCDSWDASSGGAIANTGAVTFVQASADWGTVTDFAILDALSAGNLIAYGKLTAPKAVNSGDTASFAIGDLDVTLA